MKQDIIQEAHSSFLGVPKDIAYIMRKLLSNQNLAKLLYHNTPDCLRGPGVTNTQIAEMLSTKQVCALPKIKVDKEKKTYLTINFDNFTPTETNSFYRDHTIEIRIITHFDLWNLEDNDLRVYRIAGEIDSMLNGVKLSGIGVTNLINATQDIYDEEYGGVTLNYRVVRGTEDKQAHIRPMV